LLLHVEAWATIYSPLIPLFAAARPVIVEAIVDSREYDGVVLKNDKL
jgi:hypothetical protein